MGMQNSRPKQQQSLRAQQAGFFFLATVAGARTMYSKCVLLDFLFRVFCCAGREAMDPGNKPPIFCCSNLGLEVSVRQSSVVSQQ